MYSRASISKHPIHPMIVPLPITALVLAPIALLIHLLGGGMFWLEAAWWLAIFGAIAGLVAAVPGLLDYLTIPGHSPAKGIATLHLVLNVSVVVLALVAWFLMGGFGGPSTFASNSLAALLLFVGLAVLAVSGWLGGEIVYRHGVAVEPMESVARRSEDRPEGRRVA